VTPATTVFDAGGAEWRLVPVDRSYSMRAAAIVAHNQAKAGRGDLDDCLDAAWRAAINAGPPFTESRQTVEKD
jgi:hypothetical protein